MNLPSLFRNNSEIWDMDPFHRVNQLQREMDRLFQDFQKETSLPASWGKSAFTPSCDIQEAEDHFIVSMDIPGLKKEDIKVELRGNQLSISGERKDDKEEKKKGNYRSERFYGTFERVFSLPEEVKAENIATEYKDGVLRIAFPKGKAEASQQIAIGESKPGFFERLLKKGQRPGDLKKSDKVA